MNVIFLLLTSAAGASGQCACGSAPIPVAAPIAVTTSSACDCGAVSECQPAPERKGLCARIKALFKREPAPAPQADACNTCNTCSAPIAAPCSTCAPVAAPVATTTDCGCGAVSNCCEPAPEEPKGLFARLCKRFKRKAPEPAPAADCGCASGTIISGTPGCANCAPAIGNAPVINGTIIHNHGAPVITNPGAPVITNPGKSGEPLKAMPKPEEKGGKIEGEKKAEPKGEKGALLIPSGGNVTPAGAKIETNTKNPF